MMGVMGFASADRQNARSMKAVEQPTREKIAIIGGGIGGLTAAYLLHGRHDITLFEKSNRLGGNAYTHKLKTGEGADIAVAAFGKAGYPNFYRLLDELGIKTSWRIQSYMSMQNLDSGEGYYLTPLSLRGILAQRFALLHPKHLLSSLKMFIGLRKATRRLEEGRLSGLTLQQAFGAEWRDALSPALCPLPDVLDERQRGAGLAGRVLH